MSLLKTKPKLWFRILSVTLILFVIPLVVHIFWTNNPEKQIQIVNDLVIKELKHKEFPKKITNRNLASISSSNSSSDSNSESQNTTNYESSPIFYFTEYREVISFETDEYKELDRELVFLIKEDLERQSSLE